MGPKEKSLNFQLCFQSATTMYFSLSISQHRFTRDEGRKQEDFSVLTVGILGSQISHRSDKNENKESISIEYYNLIYHKE